MQSTLFIILLASYYIAKKLISDIRMRIACVKYSIPEARWLSFHHKVFVQSDAKIKGLDAYIKNNQIFLSLEASTLPEAELKALLLHELGHRHFQSPCQLLADHYALKHSQETAFAFICLTKRYLEKDPTSDEMRSRAIRAVKFYRATYKNIPSSKVS